MPIQPKMSMVRILVGGAVAGLLMNIGEAALHAGVLGSDAEQLYAKLNVPLPNPGDNLPFLIGMTFVLGFVAVWLYAAFRPRFGPGARTALLAALVVWVLSHVWSGVYLGNGYAGIVTPRLAWIPVAWGLFEAVLGTAVGAALYKE